MQPVTVKATIEKALREMGGLSEGEQPTSHMIQDALATLNALLSQWSVEGLMVPYMSRVYLAGDNTKASYSWGPGGDIDSSAPVDVAAISFKLASLIQPVRKVENTVYMQERWIANVGQPQWFYYERLPDRSMLHFDVAPFGGGFDIWAQFPLDNSMTLTEDLGLPDYYIRAVASNLAIDLCPDYGKEPSSTLVFKASTGKKVVERYNATPAPDMALDDMPAMYRGTPLPLRN